MEIKGERAAKKLKGQRWVTRKPFWIFSGSDLGLFVKHKNEVICILSGTVSEVQGQLKAISKTMRTIVQEEMPKIEGQQAVESAEEYLAKERKGKKRREGKPARDKHL